MPKKTAIAQVEEKPQFVKPVLEAPKDDASYRSLAEWLKHVKQYIDKVEAFYKPRKERTRALWQAEIDDEKKAKEAAVETEKEVKALLVAYDDAREAERIAEEKRIAEEARVKEQARLIEEAAELERKANETGDTDLLQQAQEIAAEAEVVEAPVVQLERYTRAVSGLSFRETWSAVVVDLKKLIAFVAAHPEHTNLLQANQTALNALARSQKDHFRVDGVKATKTKGAASGR